MPHDLLHAPRDAKPGSILVIAPRDVTTDELRLARLGDYLHAEFPDLDFTVSERNRLPGNQGAVAIIPNDQGENPFSDAEGRKLVNRVVEAVRVFADYGDQRH